MTDRLQNLKKLLANHPADVFAINPGSMMSYLTGINFHLSERPVVLLISSVGQNAIILPEFEKEQLQRTNLDLIPFTYLDNPANWHLAFEAAIEALGLKNKTIGIAANQFRYLEMSFFLTSGIQFMPAEGVFAQLRTAKDESEVADMQKAAQIAEAALEQTLQMIKPGVTEKEIANELTYRLLKHGCESELPFQPYVGSGPNGAIPHGSVTDRQIIPGDLIVIDFGARWNGYCSDITRTFALGNIAPERAHIYEIVKEANRAGREAARAGIPAGDVDRAARSLIDQAGYAQYFTHRTGHGLGLDIHEDPYLFLENQLILQPGMTATIEPGIYIPEQFGVRIEDDIVITAQGATSLTTFPRELIHL